MSIVPPKQISIELISDQAIAESTSNRSDALDFSSYANVIARIVRGTRGPFTIGVFGEWGMGKTSLMRLISHEVKLHNTSHSTIIPVWFNAWMFEKVEYPAIPLIKSVVEALKNRGSNLDTLSDATLKLIDTLEALVTAFKIKGKLAFPGSEVGVEFNPNKITENFSRIRKRRNPIPENTDNYEQIFEAFRKIGERAVPSDITIMVIIDDLDRCFPENAVRLLESIKLVLSQPGFVFILGASRVIIEDYLRSKYEKQFGIKNFDGGAYLDKMIQLTFDIPPHASRINSFTNQIISSLNNKTTKNSLRPISSIIGETCQYNPRTIIRFINRLITDSAIYKQTNNSAPNSSLPVGIFAITRSLQQTWRDFYGLMVSGDNKEDREYCHIVAEWSDQDISEWKKYNEDISISSPIIPQPKVVAEDIRKNRLVDPGALRQIATYLANDRVLKSLLQQTIGIQWLTNHTLREGSISFLMAQPEIEAENTIATTKPDNVPEFDNEDNLYESAVKLVMEAGKASSSLLQRRMRVGYARAARMIERMENEGIVSVADGARPREVLVNSLITGDSNNP